MTLEPVSYRPLEEMIVITVMFSDGTEHRYYPAENDEPYPVKISANRTVRVESLMQIRPEGWEDE